MRIPLRARAPLFFIALWSAMLPAAGPHMAPDVASEARTAAQRGLSFLRSSQGEDGAWSRSVGITALALRAFLESPGGMEASDAERVQRGIDFLRANVREDGSISEGIQNRSYNTATAIFALDASGDPTHAGVIRGGQRFLSGLQLDVDAGYDADHRYHGGIGYGGDERPDLSNQYLALEALRKTSMDPEDPLWKKALVFVTRTQNRSESNDQAWAANDGGFTYMPGYSPYGGTASYGGMTHAGLISLIFAGVDREDPRVQSAYDWIRANYTLDEHPGVKGRQGLFYYYTAFAKSMSAFGEPEVVSTDGVRHNWRDDLARKLIDYQGEDGSWINPHSAQWWEDVKDLITARSVIALNLALR